MKNRLVFVVFTFLISCNNPVENTTGSTNMDSSELKHKDSLKIKNSIDSISQKEVSCDSLITLLGRSSSFDKSINGRGINLNYMFNDFNNGVLLIQASTSDDNGGSTIFGILDLHMKNKLLTINQGDTPVVIKYDTSLFTRLVKHCKFYHDDGVSVPNDSVKYIK